MEVAMHVSVFEYRLKDIDEEGWAQTCLEVAPVFAQVPGLVSKVWLKGADGGYGGVYIWDSESSYRNFLASDFGQGLGAHPNIDGLTMRDWEVDVIPTEVTRGVLQPV
jgi:hypothetical protein